MKTALLLLVLFPFLVRAQTAQEFYAKAQQAKNAGDTATYYTAMMETYRLYPHHAGVLYECGVASLWAKKITEGAEFLKRSLLLRADANLAAPELTPFKNIEGISQLETLQATLLQPAISSDTAFVLKDRALHIESVSTGEADGIFYLASIHKRKIIRVDKKGNVTDFTTGAQHGMAAVFNVKVDASKKILWACASPLPEMENFDSTAVAAVYQFDLRTKNLLGTFTPESDKKEFVFGDLVLDRSGNVFVSDSRNNIVFKLNERSRKLEPFFTSDEFLNIQGIAFNADGRYLFIADYLKGIYRLDMNDKKLVAMVTPANMPAHGTDGLIFYDNSLIAIQNAVSPMRVIRFHLNVNANHFTSFSVIDRGHPAFNEPTGGCVSGDTLYYIANSTWSGYDDQQRMKPASELPEPVVLKARLKK